MRIKSRTDVYSLVTVAILSFALHACGSSGSGGGSSQLTLEPLSTQRVLTEPVQWFRDSIVLAPAEPGTFLLARSGVPDLQTIRIQKFDGELEARGSDAVVSTNVPSEAVATSLCTANGQISVGFSDTIPFEQQPLGIILDLGNVRAATIPSNEDAATPFSLNSNTIGRQSEARVACLSDGTLAALWLSVCTGDRKISNHPPTSVGYDPPECATEPHDGLYLGRFDEAGQPEAAMDLLVARKPDESPFIAATIAALPNGRFLVTAANIIRIYDRDGAVLDEGTLPLEIGPHISCSAHRCVAVTPSPSVVAVVIDPDDLANTQQVDIKSSVTEVDEPGHRVDIVPYEGSVSCDTGGICLVTWRLVREITSSDTGETEELGMYAVALDSDSGEVGPETELVDAASVAFNDEGPISVAIRNGEFVTARVSNETVILQRLDIH